MRQPVRKHIRLGLEGITLDEAESLAAALDNSSSDPRHGRRLRPLRAALHRTLKELDWARHEQ
jgi:hypothetical protein